MALLTMLPFVALGAWWWWRRARAEVGWMLVAPLVVAVAFWGIAAQGLGAALLQPTGALLVVLAALALARTDRRIVALAGVLGAVLESATVVWWAWFHAAAGASSAAVAVAILLGALSALLLLRVTVRPPGAI